MWRIGLCQCCVSSSKSNNLTKAIQMIREASQRGSQLIILPECFNSPYGTKHFPKNAEILPSVGQCGIPSDSETIRTIAAEAKRLQTWIVAGSIPERDVDHRLYNTTMVLNPDGMVMARYRKIHLFKINTATVTFDESTVLTGGSEPQSFTIPSPTDGTPSLTVGLGICFDIRYPQLASYYSSIKGTHLLVYPGAFNMATGPAHWTLAARSRAVDTQQFVCMVSPARSHSSSESYIPYGHSLLVDPWGDVVAEAGESEEIIVTDVNLKAMEKVRAQLPIVNGLRRDLYSLDWK